MGDHKSRGRLGAKESNRAGLFGRARRVVPVGVAAGALVTAGLVLAPGTATAAPSAIGASAKVPSRSAERAVAARVDTRKDKCFATAKVSAKVQVPTHLCLHKDTDGAGALPARAKTARAGVLKTRKAATGSSSTATAKAVTPAAAVLPSQCSFGTFEGGNQPDRFTSCSDNFWTLYTWIEEDGAVEITGWLDFEDLQYITDNKSTPSWVHGFILEVYDGDGDLLEGTPVTFASGCELDPTACESGVRQIGQDAGGTAFDAIPYTSWSSEWDEVDNGDVDTIANSVDYLDEHLGVQISGDGPFNPWSLDDIWEGLVARCDNIVTGAACVNPDFVPTLTYDSRANPLVEPVAQHIYSAQRGGLATAWGLPSDPLYRDTSQADIDANRRAACGRVIVPTGQSCDEFPLASTYEGAAFQSDYSTALVPESANNSQGGITSNFYTGNRVLDSDPFYVLAYLANGSPSW